LAGAKARVFGPKEGVANVVGAIVPDAEGNLWIPSNHGIVRLENAGLRNIGSPNELPVRYQEFDIADGLPSVECPVGYGSTAARGKGNSLWFATLKGVARIDASALKLNTQPPPVYIEDVRMDSGVAAVHRPGFQKEVAATIEVPAGTRRVEIGYAAICLSAPQKVVFQSRLENFDKDWQDVGSRRTAYLQDLRPGEYRFRVRAANNDGVWNERGATIEFSVLPFFYETWWFRFGAIGGLSGLVWLGFRRSVRDRVGRQVERVRQQAALSELQARLALVLENTTDVVSFATPQGNLLFLNGAGRRLLGLPAEAPVAALRLADLQPERARARLENEALPGAIANGSWQRETTLRRADGTEIPVSQLILTHRHGDGTIDFISAIARDVSDARRAEEARSGLEKQLRAAQKMDALGTLAGGIAHDFNNILTGILGNAEMLRFTLPQDETTQQQLGSIIRASARARDLIKQMLAFGRPQESGRAPVRIWPAVQEAIVLLRASIPASVEIIPECADETAVALADTVQIHQVIMNLGANAAHAMADNGGQLRIRQEVVEISEKDLQAHPKLAVGKWIKIMVADTGFGMAPETLERIFEPFFTTKPPGQGTGLGLAVVHGIVRGHNGVLEVRSVVNLGTTFDLYFPLVTDLEPMAQTGRAEIRRGSGERILLVDDEDLVLKVSAKFLEQLGYQCVPFSDPVEALVHFQAHSKEYDLLLTDLSMPRLSGTGLAAAIREMRPNFPVVLSTGFSGRMKPGEAQRAGVREILSKPYRMDELAQALRRALDK
jgi:PAS domain S-box-containing protein